MTDLKPCPFCGGEASFKPRSFKTSCDLCGAYVPTGATSSDESIAAWNHRAPSAALIRAEEALAPFDEMAGEMFARNWNDDGVVISFITQNGPLKLTFKEFHTVHTALSKIKKLRNK